ncbi:phytanoyl-CoA dioxygenase family protein [Lentzea sp. NPDC003310]|uniref:phytanoyl-CoA dioxygenase family protein n=1 Tax=Lentzea sp. NPDC003310 TaxID=3154447 RepID=UPI0033B070B5
MTHQQPPVLDAAALEQFDRLGYLVLPGFLPEDLVDRLRPEVDRWVDDGLRARSIDSAKDPRTHGVPPVVELELPAHGELITYRPLMELLEVLLGKEFVFHHLHSDRQAPDLPGKAWHHDYEQGADGDRSHLMIHTLHYLDGLGDDTASLVVLPGSHLEDAGKTARAHLGTDVLPGELVLDRLPPGSTVVLHSALFHARRTIDRPSDRPRYFMDSSYCQTGTQWPPVKPYWRHILDRARALGLGADRPELFAERHFTEFAGASGGMS